MSGLWADQGRARLRETKYKERQRKTRIRKRRVQTVRHPVKTAKKRWLSW